MEQPINLSDWVGGLDERESIRHPFSIGDFTYATNGHVAIRVPRIELIAENSGAPASAAGLFEEGANGMFEPLPESAYSIPPPARLRQCACCGGSGHAETCASCKGEGTHDCDCEYCEEDCRDCDGTGFVPAESATSGKCSKCNGRGTDPDERIVAFERAGAPSIAVRARFLSLAMTLGAGLEVSLPSITSKPIFFRQGNVLAAAMPMYHSGPGDVTITMPAQVTSARESADV